MIVEGRKIKAVGATWPSPTGPGARPGRRDPLPRLHRRPYPPDPPATADFNQRSSMRCAGRSRRRRSSDRIRADRPRPGSRPSGLGSGDFLDVGLRNSINKGFVPGPRMQVCVQPSVPGRTCRRTGFRHDLFATTRGGGHRQRPRSAPRGGPLSGQVRGRRHQVLRLGRRALAGRRGRHAATDPRGDDRPGRRGPPAPQEGRRHSHGDLAARDAVLAGVDSIEHGTFLTVETLS